MEGWIWDRGERQGFPWSRKQGSAVVEAFPTFRIKGLGQREMGRRVVAGEESGSHFPFRKETRRYSLKDSLRWKYTHIKLKQKGLENVGLHRVRRALLRSPHPMSSASLPAAFPPSILGDAS